MEGAEIQKTLDGEFGNERQYEAVEYAIKVYIRSVFDLFRVHSGSWDVQVTSMPGKQFVATAEE